MTIELTPVHTLLLLPVLMAGALAFGIMASVKENIYRDISSTVVVEERYDNCDSKKAAIVKCAKMLEDNGYVISEIKTVCYGKHSFIKVSGTTHTSKEHSK